VYAIPYGNLGGRLLGGNGECAGRQSGEGEGFHLSIVF